MSDQQQPPADAGQPTEEELRAYAAQLEEQMKQLRVEDVVVQTVVTLINLGGRRSGLAPGTEGERDSEQLRLAVEGARALLGLIEGQLGEDGRAIRQALSQLQMAYVQMTTAAGAASDPAAGGSDPGAGGGTSEQGEETPGPGPAQSSGRLWVPGQ